MTPAVVARPETAPFDDCRKALVFALNHHQATPPTAMMNAMMASVKIEEKKRKVKRKDRNQWAVVRDYFDAISDDSPHALLEREVVKSGRRRTDLLRHPSLRHQGLSRADEAHLAGFVLHHFRRLDHVHQLVLSGLLTIPRNPCECRMPCCCGWRPVESWVAAVRGTCENLMLRADVLKQPGKKGLSSQPFLRQLLVELYYLKEGPTLLEIAKRSKVSTVTAAAHREWIHSYLGECESKAWSELGEVFDQAGITGAAP
jgi:hypothetical protein